MGKVIIFSAPSGSGKTTIVRELLKRFPQFEFSVSATSRAPRGCERHGCDYHFMTHEEFMRAVAENRFVEWEEVYQGTCYGTLRSEVERIWAKGNIIVFDVGAYFRDFVALRVRRGQYDYVAVKAVGKTAQLHLSLFLRLRKFKHFRRSEIHLVPSGKGKRLRNCHVCVRRIIRRAAFPPDKAIQVRIRRLRDVIRKRQRITVLRLQTVRARHFAFSRVENDVVAF